MNPDGKSIFGLLGDAGDKYQRHYDSKNQRLILLSTENGDYKVIDDDNPLPIAYDYADQRLYFRSSREGQWDLWSVNSDGDDLSRETNTEQVENRPHFDLITSRLTFECDDPLPGYGRQLKYCLDLKTGKLHPPLNQPADLETFGGKLPKLEGLTTFSSDGQRGIYIAEAAPALVPEMPSALAHYATVYHELQSGLVVRLEPILLGVLVREGIAPPDTVGLNVDRHYVEPGSEREAAFSELLSVKPASADDMACWLEEFGQPD
jgi:hypothetical protein